MAGIGYKIRDLMDEQTFTGDFKAYFFAGVVSSGPWLVSIMCMGLLWVFSGPYLYITEQKLFRVVVVHTYAYSLIMTGVIQFILNRYIADKLYLKQKELLLPTYIGVITFTVVSHIIAATLFYSFCDIDLHFKIIGIMLFVAVSCIWQTMIFLSASRDFLSISIAFFAGNLLGLVLAVIHGKFMGLNGYLLGYTIGQICIMALLMYRVFDEFYSKVFCNFDFLKYAGKYFDLFLIGVFYYFALWVDKILYWYSPTGEHNKALFYSHYPYDSIMFLAYLTIIPALAHFMISVETNFYDTYKGFYGSLVNHGPLKEIRKMKAIMTKTLRHSASEMLLLQIAITGGFLCFGSLLLKMLHLDQKHLSVLWTAGVGTFFHIFVLLSLIIILYFDRRRMAMYLSAFFLLTNTAFTLYVIKFRPYLMGAGYALSTFLTAILGLYLLVYSIENIEYLTFVDQPILKPKLPKQETEEPAGSVKNSTE